ncbi:hypothetical protein KGA66_15470 [Actinocrinis puniceicyclus]|uniref:Uncharacterized protein n=1 Tax=Actinocrinis puniceicyclus TaxID=977794 RepID=A0A8J7WLA8_9ACTN|nr:DUF5719 family protein [Actinocrinis puniceicyclus]MBS2964456.1 hypothetical protein [Actinocrinis puniceicyclus]
MSTPDDSNTWERPPADGGEQLGQHTPGRPTLSRPSLSRTSLGRVGAQATAGAGRRIQVAVAVFAAIGVGVAYGYGVAPAASKPQTAVAAKSTPVRTATLVCPDVIGSNDATVNAITPAGAAGGITPAAGDKATLTALGGKSPLATLKQPGALSVNTGLGGNIANIQQESIPITGQAGGGYAPGFTVTETLAGGTTAGTHGLASTPCTAPDTDFWFLGADPGEKSNALINLFDSDQLAAQVNLTAYTPTGQAGLGATELGQGRLVPPGGQHDPIDLNGFSSTGDPIALHVVATAGRVSAALLDSDGMGGRDFLLAQKPAAHLMLPGIPAPSAKPASRMKLQLLLFSPTTDTDASLHWIGTSKIVPTVTAPHLTAGKVEQLDISSVPGPGEAGALQIDTAGNVPILAAIKVTAEGGTDTAYLSPVPALAGEAVVADDKPGSSVELTNNGTQSAQAKVTIESATGAPTPQTVTIPAQSTKLVALQAPQGATSFAVSVAPLAGAASLYAARVMSGGGMLTIQPMATALETVQIPAVLGDLSGSVPQP